MKRNGIPEANAARVACDLTFGNEESLAILRSYPEAHPKVALGKGVELALERAAPDWQEKLQKYGRDWRDKREHAMLAYLTTQLIDRVPYVPVPMSKILEVMGEPDSHVDRSYTYVSKDKERQTGFLYLEVDPEGKVVAWKLD